MGCGVALLYVISVVMLTAAYAVNIESDPWSDHEAFPGVRDNVGALVALVIAVVALLCASIGFALRRKSPLFLVGYFLIATGVAHRMISLVPQLLSTKSQGRRSEGSVIFARARLEGAGPHHGGVSVENVCRARIRAGWLTWASTLVGHVPPTPLFDLRPADRLVHVARSE